LERRLLRCENSVDPHVQVDDLVIVRYLEDNPAYARAKRRVVRLITVGQGTTRVQAKPAWVGLKSALVGRRNQRDN
jgi:hypothetical protein